MGRVGAVLGAGGVGWTGWAGGGGSSLRMLCMDAGRASRLTGFVANTGSQAAAEVGREPMDMRIDVNSGMVGWWVGGAADGPANDGGSSSMA